MRVSIARAVALGAIGTASLLASAAPTQANWMREADARVALVIETVGPPAKLGEPFQLFVTAHGFGKPALMGRVRLVLVRGFRHVSGDLDRTCHISDRWRGTSDREWAVAVVPEREGPYEIRGELDSVGRSGSVEEMEIVVVGSLTSEGGLALSPPRVVRSEVVERGQRYRLGGSFRVPIPARQWVVPSMIRKSARQPGPLSVVCSACPRGAAKSVHLIAFVDESGKVVDVRPVDGGMDLARARAGDPAFEAAEMTVRRTHFEPARTDSAAVAGWCLAEVSVEGNADGQ